MIRSILTPVKRLVRPGGASLKRAPPLSDGRASVGIAVANSEAARSASLADRTRWIWMPGILFAISRLGIILAVYLGSVLLPESSSPPPYHLRGTESLLLDVFGSRWDTGFFVSIAEEGYRFEGVPLPSVPFFPLLPLLMRALTPITGDAVVSGILVSNLALFLAMAVFYKLAALEQKNGFADRAVWYTLIFPAAFFGAAVYSESLFLLGAIGALYSARKGYWELAALLGIVTTLSRFMGIIVVPMLLIEWWTQFRQKPLEERPRRLAALAGPLSLLGLGAFMTYLWRSFGDPLAFVHGSQAWARAPKPLWEMIGELIQAPPGGWLAGLSSGAVHVDNWIDFLMLALFLALGLVLFRQRRWSESAFVLSGVLIAGSSGLWMSQRRYMWVLFPAFLVLARWGDRPWVDRLVTALSLIGLGIFTALFANGYWVG
ncbi:MAG TPA: mannosyltransferase family protein [Anaerolineales bacterium]|nr:mannosyltransferase family protein [Anaerolineales bacterium]